MHIASNFLLKELDGQYLMIPVGKIDADFNELITVNEIGVFLWEELQEERTEEELVQRILEEYEVEEDVAREDVRDFIELLQEGGALI